MLTMINGKPPAHRNFLSTATAGPDAGKPPTSPRWLLLRRGLLRPWLLRTLALLLLFGALLPAALSPAPAYACSCAGPETVEAALQSKSHIFAGTVTKIDKRSGLRLPWGSYFSGDPVSITFHVTEVWKGGPESQLTVRTAMGSESCGIETFQVGQPYLVYAHKYNGELSTNICERTKPLASAAEDLQLLGPGVAPTTGGAATSIWPAAGWAAALLALAAAAAVALLAARRRRRR